MACFWSNVEQCPLDAIFGLVETYESDPRVDKVNLAIGTYVDLEDKPYVLDVVRKVSQHECFFLACIFLKNLNTCIYVF